jgi:hypothetical protein
LDLTAVFGVNTNLHPTLARIELEYPRCKANSESPEVLGLRDLSVAADPELKRLILFRKKDRRQLNLVPLNFLFPLAGPSLYRFLFLLTTFVNFRGGLSERCTFFDAHHELGNVELPRITLGSLVLDRRTWKYPIKELGAARIAAFHGASKLMAAERWRKNLRLPEETFFRVTEPEEQEIVPTDWTDELKKWVSTVRLTRNRKPHYVHFRNPFLVDILLKQLETTPNGTAIFQECLPPSNTYLDPGAPQSAEEFVVQLNHGGERGRCE